MGLAAGGPAAGTSPGRLEISLRSIHQLFNSLDPSPFYERDLDSHAENYLVSWAQELPPRATLSLCLRLSEPPPALDGPQWIEAAVQHYFAERERLKRAELRGLLRQGRTSLGIGLLFLTACLLLSQWSQALLPSGVMASLLRESFLVGGWVAMWRPMQIYLYDWWPLGQQALLYRRMSRMPVTLRLAPPASSTPA
ncbi:hypothetical protein ED208_03200 [Stagnimonas aquatica]|uniref:Uncharacterized protein n=1 Tax=Stagnimonas aquatica TaxID=2689987 RepID=A0A3N0VLC8_9GAMM|nr:hypothetical protein [Stagnimonas aquatica]ROH93540.1 hypothetical protein ED208_03200 [Stagnimonas aquatica]